ncbi:MAG TPA: ABC transporter permease, partial [Clostridiales bacterium]|nr:ABC transporter permease [Clostridiales bacterium]
MVMRGNSAWSKNNKREIKHTWERYIAIVAIIVLGVGFFSGLKVTKTAMVKNLDGYVNEYDMYDYRLLSTLGLTEADVEYFNLLEDIKSEGAITADVIVDVDKEGAEKGIVLKAHSIGNSINKLKILHGRMAEADNEIVLDSKIFTEDIIGSNILIADDNNEDTIEAFKYNEYSVVGIADAPSYINFDRGTTSIGKGSVYAFAYIPENGFTVDYYTEIMLLMDTQGEIYSDEYEDMIADKEESLKETLEARADLRYKDILGEANETLADAEKEYDEGYQEYISEKTDAEEELDEAWLMLLDAKQEIEDNEEKLRDGDIKIADGEAEYQKGLKNYQEGLLEFENEKADALATLEASQDEIDDNRETLVSAMKQIEDSGVLTQYSQLKEAIPQLEYGLSQISDQNSVEYLTMNEQLNQSKAAVNQIEATGVIQQYEILESSLVQLEAGQIELNKGKKEAQLQFAEAEKTLADGKVKLVSAYIEIEKNKEEIKSAWEALNEGKAEYEDGLIEYEDGKKEAKEAFAEAEEELAKARIELDDARKEVDDIPEEKVFVLNRNHNSGYVNFDSDSSIVDGIAEVLPIFFFLVAALVCSTTMTRMVDEQRTQIGTLKALGYSNGAISRKYIFYSGSAALIGCVGGFLVGTKLFPVAIWKAYGMLYDFSPIEYIFDIKLAIISLIVSLMCSAGVTYISCKSELLQMPASLIRPKAPKAGKRVLLEKVPFIWKRVSFLHKVSIRNILRYKRRFFMTITGIAGCTALIVAAMGIRDSIKNVANDQFGSIMTYDYDILFSEEPNSEEKESFINTYGEELSEWVFVSTDEVEIVDGDILKKTS